MPDLDERETDYWSAQRRLKERALVGPQLVLRDLTLAKG